MKTRTDARSPCLHVMLVDRRSRRSFELADALEQEGCAIVSRPERSDVVVVGADAADERVFEELRRLGDEPSVPVVLFVEESDADAVHTAVRAGVAAYVVKGLTRERLRPVIDVAIARFQELERMRKELRDVRSSLTDRKLVERAKGILMKSRGLSEEEAYGWLRKSAMSHNVKLSVLARRVIEMSDLL